MGTSRNLGRKFLGVAASTVVILAVALPLTTGVASAWSSPTLSTTAQSSADNVAFSGVTGPIALNSYVRDTALLSGAATPTTGSVLYTLYSGTSCDGNTPTGSVVFSDTETLASNTIPASKSFQVTTAGTYQWQAVYTSGNSQNYDATSPCGSETFTVTTPVLSVVKSSTPASGSTVALGSTVSYGLTLSNAGTAAATGITVTDAVPAGTTYVDSSASCGGATGCTVTEANSTVTWTGITVQPGSTNAQTLTFKVTVNANDTNGEVIPNFAVFTNVGTPTCTTATCNTNTVTVTVSVRR